MLQQYKHKQQCLGTHFVLLFTLLAIVTFDSIEVFSFYILTGFYFKGLKI